MSDKPHVVHNSGNNEWYTPPNFIDSVRLVLGQIDLDPASNEIAQEVIKASTYYTQETNGLDKDWVGKVFMNPPYSAGLLKQFISKLVREYNSGNVSEFIVLVNNATETGWFSDLSTISEAVCFTEKRIRFHSIDGVQKTPLQGQAFLYGGKRPRVFADVFKKHGMICKIVRD